MAVYLSAHGLGHAVRAAAVLARLAQNLPLSLVVVGTSAARAVWPVTLRDVTEAWHDEPCDVGVVQSDDVTVDRTATGRSLERWVRNYASLVDREATRLGSGVNLVVGDVPSVAFDAADLHGIQSVAIANFSWDWIYARLGFPEAAALAARGYQRATLLLEATPSAPMASFARRTAVGLVARPASALRDRTRASLGLRDGDVLVLLAFQPTSAPAVVLPPREPRRFYVAPAGWPAFAGRPDLHILAPGARFEDALAAADIVVGKPGYGLLGDVEVAGLRFLYVPRPGFPENEVLERHLAGRCATAPLDSGRLASADWQSDLARLEAQAAPAPLPGDGAARAAAELARVLAGPCAVDSVAATE